MDEQKTPEKRCIGPCGQEYPATKEFFHKASGSKDKLKNKCKKCCNDEVRAYKSRPEVKERLKERRKEYLAIPENKERTRATQKAYYARPQVQERQKARLNTYHKEYYARPEVKKRVLAYQKDYIRRPGMKERKQAYKEAYRNRPGIRTLLRSYQHNYRARKRAVKGAYSQQQIRDQLKRQKCRCYYCSMRFRKVKGSYAYHVEHTFPLSRVAGTDIPANSIDYIVLSCPSCNHNKYNKFPWEWPEGGRLL